MKDKQARDSANTAYSIADSAHQRITDQNAEGVATMEAIRVLAREQARLRAVQDADLIVDDLVEAARDAVIHDHNDRLAKLEARVDALTEQLAVLLPPEPYAPERATVEDELDHAIVHEQVVEFIYEDRAGVQSLRLVSPYDLVDAANGARLLVGYDHDRDGIRQFRIERIEGAVAFGPEDYRAPQA